MGKIMEIEGTRKALCDVLNNSGLTIEMMYYVMKDVMNEVTIIYDNSLREEIKAEAGANVAETMDITEEEADVDGE